MFDSEFAKYAATLGVGGVLAAMIFMFYRKDVKQFTDLWKTTTDQLIGVIKENTASNTELITLIKNQKEPVITKAEVEAIVTKQIEGSRTHSKRAGA